MTINDRHGNPVKLNNLYADWQDVETTRTRPFPMNYINGLCKVTILNNSAEEPYIRITYEISGSSTGGRGNLAYNLGKMLIPLKKDEVKELVNDRKRRLSFLEESSQDQPLCTRVNEKFAAFMSEVERNPDLSKDSEHFSRKY